MIVDYSAKNYKAKKFALLYVYDIILLSTNIILNNFLTS